MAEADLTIEESIGLLRAPQRKKKVLKVVQNSLPHFGHVYTQFQVRYRRVSSTALDPTGILGHLLRDIERLPRPLLQQKIRDILVDSAPFYENQIPLPNLAACLGFKRTLKHLLDLEGPWALDQLDDQGLSVLTYTIIAGSSPGVKLLLEMGVSTDASTGVFSLLDFHVVCSESLCVLQTWLEVLVLSKEKLQRLLFIAIGLYRKEAMNLLLDQLSKSHPGTGLNVEALGLAIDLQYEVIIDSLLRHGANSDMPSKAAKDLIFNAVRSGQIAVVRRLIENKFDVNWKNAHGEHALFTSVRENSLDIATYLVDNGADLSIRSKQGATAVHKLIASFLAGNIRIDKAELLKSNITGRDDAIKLLKSSANPFGLCYPSFSKRVEASTEQDSSFFSDLETVVEGPLSSATQKSQSHPRASSLRPPAGSNFVYDKVRQKWITGKVDASFGDSGGSFFR